MADHRHKRDTNARLLNPFRRLRGARPVTVAAPLAVAATASAVTLGVLAAEVPSPAQPATPVAAPFVAPASDGTETPLPRLTVSRGGISRATLAEDDLSPRERMLDPHAVRAAIARADEKRWTTDDLNLWTEPGKRAKKSGEVDEGTKVTATGRRLYGRVEIVWKNDETRWVTAGYLSEDKPLGLGAGLSDEPCPDPGVENGLTDNAVLVYRSVCHAFPQITSYGGWDDHGEHSSGRAIDIMTSDVQLGTAIAEFLRAHAAELHLYDVIWRQHIWTPERSGEGWRFMPSRGSATANHYDHVHVSTY